jgi:hypothetical protein
MRRNNAAVMGAPRAEVFYCAHPMVSNLGIVP